MAEPVKRHATYQDLLDLPPHLTGEIIFGELFAQPRPVTRHATAANRLGAKLTGRFEFGSDGASGGWVFMPEAELHLGPHVVAPDLSGWRVERLPEGYGESAYMEVPPDWICEILSPRTETNDRDSKRRIYATYDIPHFWILDPRSRHLEVFVWQDKDWLLTHVFSEFEEVSAPPVLDLSFVLSTLWPFPRAPDVEA